MSRTHFITNFVNRKADSSAKIFDFLRQDIVKYYVAEQKSDIFPVISFADRNW